MLPLKRPFSAISHSSTSTWRCLACNIQPTNPTIPSSSQRRQIQIQQLDKTKDNRERVVVLGAGWAGFGLARELDPKRFQVVTVSPRSYFVFTPLLASTSTGTLEFRTAIEPVRSRGSKGEYFQGWADDIDFNKKTIAIEEAVEDPNQGGSLVSDRHAHETKEERLAERAVQAKKGQLFSMSWDKLVIAVGCYNQTFSTKGVKEHAYFLKDVRDARKIRNRLLTCFETAALPTTSEAMKGQLLNFAVVGGGPTGIEWSAELYDIVHEDMRRLYPYLIDYVKITVYDVAPRVLSMFDEKLGQYAMDTFRREGISIKTKHHVEELRLGSPVQHEQEQQASVAKEETTCYTLKLKEEGEIGVGMCVWSTGLMMNPFVANALAGKVKRDSKSGGILTNSRLQPIREESSSSSEANSTGKSNETTDVIPDVYALGDCAIIEGTSYPATAQVASQKASWLGKRLNRGDIESRDFTYRDLGVMAYIGNSKAILQSGGGDISGRMAWLVWRGAYLAKSVSWRNRLLIPIYWALNWVFGRDISRF